MLINNKIEIKKPHFNYKFRLKKIAFEPVKRFFFQENRLLNNNILQLTNLKKTTKQYKRLKKKTNFFYKKQYFNFLKRYSTKNFLWKTTYNSCYITNYWLKYNYVSKFQSIYLFRKRYRIYIKWMQEKLDLKRPDGPKPSNPVYEQYANWWMKRRYSKMRRRQYLKKPWLKALVYKRKVYRLTRNRGIKRLKKPFNIRKFFYLRKRTRFIKNKRKRARTRVNTGDNLFRRYLFLPYVSYTKFYHIKSRSKQFKKKVKKLRRVHKPSFGFNLRAAFENKLNLVALTLNFVPTHKLSYAIHNENYYSISNKTNPSIEPKSTNRFFNAIIYPDQHLFNVNDITKLFNVNIFAIKKKISFRDVFGELYSLENSYFNGHEDYNIHYLVKRNEIVHVNLFYKNNLKNFFFKKILKKPIPNLYKENYENTAALVKREFRSEDIGKSNPVSSRNWIRATLHLKK